jgi:drug/metabolite transporter (DMT)-like permease
MMGIGLTLVAMAMLPYVDVIGKMLAQMGLPALVITFGRMFFGALVAAPFAFRTAGLQALIPRPASLQVLRGLIMVASAVMIFSALRTVPLADALAVWYVQPLVLVVLGAVLLREKLDIHRVLAVVIGFIGVMLVIKPGFQQINSGIYFALGAGIAYAFYLLVTRMLVGRADAAVTMFQSSTVAALAAATLMPFVWQWPTVEQWVLMAGMATIATAGHYISARAFEYAEATLLAPLGYTEMIMTIFAGWLFFDHLPNAITLLGIMILVACAVYVSWRERTMAKAQSGQ